MKSLARPYTYEKKMVSGLSCDIIVHQSLTCAINFIELFAELVFSESSGNDRDDVDLYEVVRRNAELQREEKASFGQLEVSKLFEKCCHEDYYFSIISPMMFSFGNWKI